MEIATLTVNLDGTAKFDLSWGEIEFTRHSDFSRFVARNAVTLVEVTGDSTATVRVTAPAHVVYFPKAR